MLSLIAPYQTPPTRCARLLERGLACATERTAQPRASKVYNQSFHITKNMHSKAHNLDMGLMTGVCIVIVLSAMHTDCMAWDEQPMS